MNDMHDRQASILRRPRLQAPRKNRGVRPPTTRRAGARRQGGFTLIEAALTTVIVRGGVLAIMSWQQAFGHKNMWAQRTATAMLLANELRELTVMLPRHDPIVGAASLGPESDEIDVLDYDDLDDFAGVVDGSGKGPGTTFSPPINALRQSIADLPGYSQRIVVEAVPDNWINTVSNTQPLDAGDTLMRVTVTIFYQGPNDDAPMTLTTLSWIVGN